MRDGHHTIKYIEFTVRDCKRRSVSTLRPSAGSSTTTGPNTPASKARTARSAGSINRPKIGPRGPFPCSIPTTWSRALRRFARPAARSSASRSRFPAAGVSTSRIRAATSSPSGRLLDRPSGDGVLWRGVNVKQVRRLALSLPEASEEPHFHLASFRVKRKIFATLAPDGSYLNVFVDDTLREVMVAVDPKAYETLWWGKNAYLHVHVGAAKAKDVKALLQASWERKAPKKLLSQSQ